METTRFSALTSALLFRSIALTGLLGFAACSSGGGRSEPISTGTVEGTFVDAPVAGLGVSYVQAGQRYVLFTNDVGGFSVPAGVNLQFFVGDVFLGEALAAEVITPIDLVDGAEDSSDPLVVEIAQLLQSLDGNDFPEDGIALELVSDLESLGENAPVSGAEYFGSDRETYRGSNHKAVRGDYFRDFTDLGDLTGTNLVGQTPVDRLMAQHGKSVLVSGDVARDHLDSSMVALHSGVYESMFEFDYTAFEGDLDGGAPSEVEAWFLRMTVGRDGRISGSIVAEDESTFLGFGSESLAVFGQVFPSGRFQASATGLFDFAGQIDGDEFEARMTVGSVLRIYGTFGIGGESEEFLEFLVRFLRFDLAIAGSRVDDSPIALNLGLLQEERLVAVDLEEFGSFELTVGDTGYVLGLDGAELFLTSSFVVTDLNSETMTLKGQTIVAEPEDGDVFTAYLELVVDLDDNSVIDQSEVLAETDEAFILYYLFGPFFGID